VKRAPGFTKGSKESERERERRERMDNEKWWKGDERKKKEYLGSAEAMDKI
jgi:hypothetical protein